MSYIGVAPTAGQYRNLDDISGSFNGSTTTFTTAVSGQSVTAGVAQQLLVSLGGVVQKPGTDYTVGTNTITFTTAPSSGLSFFGILMGEAVNVGTPSDGTVTSAKLASDLTVDLASGTVSAPSLSFDANTGLYSTADNEVAITTDGTYRAKVDGSGRLLVGTTSALGSVAKLAEVNGNVNISRFANDAFAHQLGFVKSRGTSPGTIVQNGDELGIANWYADDGTDTATVAAQIAAYVDGTPGANDMPGRLVFSTTADGASSPTERMRISNDGQIWAVASTGFNYYIAKTGAGNNFIAHYVSTAEGSGFTYNVFYRGATGVGSISYNGTGVTYNTTSDYRLKENIAPIAGAIDRLQQLKPSRFNFIADTGFDCDCTIDGFIAHEVKEVVPEAVTGEKDAVNDDGSIKPQSLDASRLVPLLTAALQEAIGEIESLKARVAALESA